MPLGPFDARTKRSRCTACFASHLKCSGDIPCENCSRRQITCTFAARDLTKKLIQVEKGKQTTAANWSLTEATTKLSSSSSSSLRIVHVRRDAEPRSGHLPQSVRPAPTTPRHLIDETSRYLSFFDLFANSNSFTGRGRSTGDELKQLAELHSRKGNHVLHAMLAVGGMFAGRRNLTDTTARRETNLVALQHYSYSIAGLRKAIDGLATRSKTENRRKVQDERVCILWTTFLLGLFELMNDATGHGWQQHIIHGTCMALQASGPSSFRSGAGFTFFTQARVFEVSRTILYNERTFLSEPDWVALSRDLSSHVDSAYTWSPLDSLLDIMVMCSDLRVRAGTFVEQTIYSLNSNITTEAMAISDAGFKLRDILDIWCSAYLHTQPETGHQDDGCFFAAQSFPQNAHVPASPSSEAADSLAHQPSILLSHVFYAAISIYLSGVFDYDLPHWDTVGVLVPTLDQQTVAQHVNSILKFTKIGLEKTSLSPVLFLFPLRIAGARSHDAWQRNVVGSLVACVGKGFAVAGAVEADLIELWDSRALQHSG
ncbi:hypothetical protein E4U13_002608 [Claviceps humidiphila]|uniref:Zn(2)-C6 fungal-type domain-containing protein n=1 Tax=Claviceps humidiphila TaxID=1294629 RepID=A0A9P7Q229_9HYPO|nr:hypothetical protein E4U13_002608 [Claviceps humidiphila]